MTGEDENIEWLLSAFSLLKQLRILPLPLKMLFTAASPRIEEENEKPPFPLSSPFHPSKSNSSLLFFLGAMAFVRGSSIAFEGRGMLVVAVQPRRKREGDRRRGKGKGWRHRLVRLRQEKGEGGSNNQHVQQTHTHTGVAGETNYSGGGKGQQGGGRGRKIRLPVCAAVTYNSSGGLVGGRRWGWEVGGLLPSPFFPLLFLL